MKLLERLIFLNVNFIEEILVVCSSSVVFFLLYLRLKILLAMCSNSHWSAAVDPDYLNLQGQ